MGGALGQLHPCCASEGGGSRSNSVRHVISYITVQHRQIGKEDDFRYVHECMYTCAFLSCAHAHIHHRLYHSLTHQIYRQFMECGEHHLTEQADLKVLLLLCRSLQDLLKYCWVTLGGRDKGVPPPHPIMHPGVWRRDIED